MNTRICAISDAISTSTSPSDTHRFVRLLVTDAGQRVRSVRPAHRVSHQKGCGIQQEDEGPRVYVPEDDMSASMSTIVL